MTRIYLDWYKFTPQEWHGFTPHQWDNFFPYIIVEPTLMYVSELFVTMIESRRGPHIKE